MAGLDPAIHPLRKIFFRTMMDPPKSGLPDFGHFTCASRINPTCVVKPAGDVCWSRFGSTRSHFALDNLVFAELVDVLRVKTEPFAQNFICVLSKQRRRLDVRRAPTESH